MTPDAGDESHGIANRCSDDGLIGVGTLIEEPRNQGQVASSSTTRTSQSQDEMGESMVSSSHGRIMCFAHFNNNYQEQ